MGFMQNLVVFLMGPTASGKTSTAVQLASLFPFDVVSVDSGQVYRKMDLGTAKPVPEVLEQVPHRLVDICEPWVPYSAGQFRKDALREIDEIHQLNRIPLLVGGTMFYFNALEKGLSDLPERQLPIRQQLRIRADTKGWPSLHAELARIDPISAEKISQNDSQRIERLLEMHYVTNQAPNLVMRENRVVRFPFPILKIAIVKEDRSSQKVMIENRLLQMIEDGLIEEAELLFRNPRFEASLPAMRLVGYRQVWEYLSGDCNFANMKTNIVRASCGLAKRQLTWIRNSSDIFWVVGSPQIILHKIKDLLDCVVDKSKFDVS